MRIFLKITLFPDNEVRDNPQHSFRHHISWYIGWIVAISIWMVLRTARKPTDFNYDCCWFRFLFFAQSIRFAYTDVQNSIKAQNSPGYERWSKLFNLKQSAKTLLFLQDNNLDDLDKLAKAAQKAKDDFNDLQSRIHAADERLKEIPIMQKHIGTYVKTKNVYAEYKRRKYSKKFYAGNEKAINGCKAAKAYFDEKGLAKLPTINSLKQEYAALTAEKKKLYSGYSAVRSHMQEILMAQQNVHQLLDYRDAELGRASDRTER